MSMPTKCLRAVPKRVTGRVLASLGIVPNSKQVTVNREQGTENASQPLNPSTPQPSQFWHLVTPSNTLQLTWQNVLLDRAADRPVSFQMELWPSGRLIYRFDLSRLDVDEVTNVLVGASLDGLAWTTNAIPTNVTSMVFHPLTPEDAENQDRDGDGLTLLDELFFHHTDPDLWDTDGDGVSDGDEVRLGANPLARDSDRDGFSDGTDPHPSDSDPWTDADGDGLPDAWKNALFGSDASVSATADANGDGVSNIAALLMGVNPTNAPSAGFRSDCGAASSRMVAWEIARTGFTFTRPAGLTNLVSRTFRVDRASPWQQLFVSSRANAAAGWFASDVRIRYGLDDGPVTNLVPAASMDSWRLPLGPDAVTNVVFVVEAVGDAPALSHPLHLIRWSPRVGIPSDESGSFMSMPTGKPPVFMSSRRAESGWYVVPFLSDFSDMPHAGSDAELDAQLALPPVRGVAVTNVPTRALLSPDPVWVELPPEGTNASVRLCCWEIRTTADGEIASGPRSSQYDSPYPLSSPELRLGFHRAEKLRSSGTVTMTIYPEHPLVGLFPPGWPRSAPQNPVRLMTVSPSTTNEPPWNPITGDPPFGGTPGIDGESFDDGYTPVDPASDETKGETTEEDDNDGCGDPDECPCGGEGDGSKQCSFRLRVSLGSSVPGEPSGFLWTALEQPTCVTTTVFNVLAAPGVSATTNAVGEFTVVDSSPGGRTVSVTNMPHGVAVSVWNASGRFEARWEVTNPEGDFNYVRCRKITILGNATSDELFCLDDGMMGSGWELPEDARVSGLDPSDQVVREDAIHGVRNVKRKWRTDPDEPEFVTDVFDEVVYGDERVSALMSEFAKFGEGSTARRRLVRRYGFDEQGELDETRDYWNDAGSRRHARLRSIRSNRQAWSFHDYDERGRETVLLEQLDGSPFPDGLAFGGSAGDAAARGLAALPTGCSAKATVTSYAPATGDSDDRNDVDQPRRRDVYVLRAGRDPVLIGTETWLYTRSIDSMGVPLRTCVHSTGIGSTLRSETTVEYPEGDYAVPKELRGRAVSSLDFDGVLATHVLERGTWDPATRTFTASPSGDFLRTTTRRSRDGVSAKTYSVAVENALRHLEVYRVEVLTADDATIDWLASTYDDVDRLRATVYPDGTFETNAYSCCRLLWRQDRQGHKVLRSARTGTDDLYYAEEEVWLGELNNEEWRMENGGATNAGFRVTRHFFDALGRETNTIVGISHTPGASTSPTSILHSSFSILHSSFPSGGSDCLIHTDARGRDTVTWKYAYDDCDVTTIETRTNDLSVVYETRTAHRNGGSSTRREWTDRDPSGGTRSVASEERRFDEYTPAGLRVSYVVTESSDCGTVTNSVTRHDLLGRVVSKTVPGANGAWIETRSFYDGVSSRLVRTETDGEPDVIYGYDELGDRIFTAQSGITNRTVTTYETVSGVVWRVTTATRLTATTANTVRVTKERLTGLSDDCCGEIVTIDASGYVTVVRKVFDPATGLMTETMRTGSATPIVSTSRFGLALDKISLDEHQVHAYDAFGRVAGTTVTHAGTEETVRSESYSYDLSGNVTTNAVEYTGSGRAVASSVFDALNCETVRTDALGHSFWTMFDPLGRIVAVDGDQYPLRTDYDTAGRKTRGFTTRDGGATWDETRREYDPASGLNTAKVYADGSRITYDYTDNGRKTRTTWARGVWRENAYNTRGLVGGVTYSDATPAVSYTYTQSRQLASAALSDGTSYAYFYDDRLLCTNEVASGIGGDVHAIMRTYDDLRRPSTTSVAVTNIAHAAKTRFYDSENRVSGYALSNAAGRGISVALTYDGSYLTNTVYTLPNGSQFTVRLQRDPGRRNLITRRDHTFNGNSIYWYSTGFDLLGRPTNAVDSISIARTYLYNRRSELAAAQIGTNNYGYVYDTIGNRQWSSANGVMNLYTANCLDQYSCVQHSTFNVQPSYDADGNLTSDGRFSYAYDAENRMLSACPVAPSQGDLAVVNAYDHKHRRIMKCVERFDGEDWQTSETHTFVWDDMNIVLERIAFANGSMRTVEYFWGNDLSGTEQGAGGVGGLLAVSIDGTFFIPCYDHNGNIVCYVSESGTIAGQYVYDPYGNVTEQYGTLADRFAIRFSTKYTDVETGLISYLRRFYRPDHGRWLNRDPIEERGGENLYAFCANAVSFKYDKDGCAYFALRPLAGAPWLGLASHNFLDDLLNTEIAHEHLFFEDGKSPSDYGLHGDIGQDGKQVFHGEDSSRYRHFERGYNDCVMRIAVANVKPKPYSVLGSLKASKYNCQDYCSDLRREYFRLLFDNSVRKKCCIGSKDRK